MNQNLLNRRSFLKKGSLAALAGAAFAAPVHAMPLDASNVKKWDLETDVVVIGGGAAGINAAIGASRAGAKVILFEKSPQLGGNSGVNLGGIILPKTLEDAVKLYSSYAFDTVTKQDIEEFARQIIEVPAYLKALGFDKLKYRDRNPTFPNLSGPMKLTGTVLNPTGRGAIAAFKKILEEEPNATVMLESPVVGIVRKDVDDLVGVIVQKGDDEIYVKARRGIVLSCGGYENNKSMIANYNYPGIAQWIYPCGTPYNSGDGIKLAISCGANLWHFPSLEWSGFCSLEASRQFGVAVPLPFFGLYGKNYIYVNKYGQRFMKDTQWLMHTKEPINAINFSNGGEGMEGKPAATEFSNLPPWLVFDETTRKKGPVCANEEDTKETRGDVYWYSVVHGLYNWSNDNLAEIEKGWILKADTIGELAQKMGVPQKTLEETVAKYNQYCKDGVDPEFGREKKNLQPIETPPFYAMQVGLAMINTQGGPVRNGQNQIVDTYGVPIPRLYGAGELGSFFGFLYQGATNFPEAIITGYNSGTAAAHLAPME